jgi:ubiquinone/menaquinone biosynthesis C-methylase UbiE
MDEHPLFARFMQFSAELGERKGAAEHRRALVRGLRGRVLEVGAGSGVTFRHYPASVEEVVAVEPEPTLRAAAQEAAREAPVAVHVVDGVADALPLGTGSVDAAVVSAVLCSVPDQARALAELRRVLRPGGELRFYEHVAARRPGGALLQRAAGATFWPRVFAGCDPHRDTEAAIRAAGFEVVAVRRFTFAPTPVDAIVASKVLGVARAPGA